MSSDVQASFANGRCVGAVPAEFLKTPVLKPRRADAIGTQQRHDRHTALRQAARVLLGR